MIPAPVLSDWDVVSHYLIAVKDSTGVVQVEVGSAHTIGAANAQVARLWGPCFSEEQKEAILAAFAARRMSR